VIGVRKVADTSQFRAEHAPAFGGVRDHLAADQDRRRRVVAKLDACIFAECNLCGEDCDIPSLNRFPLDAGRWRVQPVLFIVRSSSPHRETM
jgi:hypothetical protein